MVNIQSTATTEKLDFNMIKKYLIQTNLICIGTQLELHGESAKIMKSYLQIHCITM